MAPSTAEHGHCLGVFEWYHSDPANAHTFKSGEGTTTFFDLPRELRDMVYDLATLNVEVRPMNKNEPQHAARPNGFNAMNSGLLLTSKQVRFEVLEQKVYFTNTIFTFTDQRTAMEWVRKLSASYRPELRTVHFAPISDSQLEWENEPEVPGSIEKMSMLTHWWRHSMKKTRWLRREL